MRSTIFLVLSTWLIVSNGNKFGRIVGDAALQAAEYILHNEPKFADQLKLGKSSKDIIANFVPPDNSWGPFAFFPYFTAYVNPGGDDAQWSTPCFVDNQVTIQQFDSTGFTFTINSFNKTSYLCSDYYMFATRNNFWLREFLIDGKHIESIVFTETDDYNDIARNGLRIFRFPLGVEGTAASLYKTYEINEETEGFQQRNIDWLATRSPLFNFSQRSISLDLDESLIPDGSVISISRFDGSHVLIMFGTGSVAGHTAIAFRDPSTGELFVHESMDVPPGSTEVWPLPYGVIRTPWKQWVSQASNGLFNADILTLAPNFQGKFNATKAQEFFNSVQGLPYGYHNFLFGWLDDIINNFPINQTSPELIGLIIDFLDYYLENGTKIGIDSMVLKALNHRTQKNFFSSPDFWRFLENEIPANKNIFQAAMEIIEIPELDSWIYTNPSTICNRTSGCSGSSMVCGSFAIRVLKAAGIFGENSDELLQGTEFTPKDVYQIQIWDPNFQPQGCDFTGFCQIMGNYKYDLPGFNSIPIYSHMNEKCGALPPLYIRPQNC